MPNQSPEEENNISGKKVFLVIALCIFLGLGVYAFGDNVIKVLREMIPADKDLVIMLLHSK